MIDYKNMKLYYAMADVMFMSPRDMNKNDSMAFDFLKKEMASNHIVTIEEITCHNQIPPTWKDAPIWHNIENTDDCLSPSEFLTQKRQQIDELNEENSKKEFEEYLRLKSKYEGI